MISVANDGYIQNPGVGYMLSTYYLYEEVIDRLIDGGDLDSLESPSDLNENIKRVGLNLKENIEDTLQYCIEKHIDYLYVYENKKWYWLKIDKDVNTDSEFEQLSTNISLDYADKSMVDKPKWCSFRTAVRWGDVNLVLLNNIMSLDPDFNPYEGFYESSEEDEDKNIPEFYQYYITSMSDDDVEWHRKVFPDITYSYSNLLESWVLCVAHYGTSWDYVPTQYIGNINYISEEEFARFNKQ